MFILLLGLLLCARIYGSASPVDLLPPKFSFAENPGMSIQSIEEGGICVPEFCYAVTRDAQKYPLLMIGASPCVGVFITTNNAPLILALHVSAHNALDQMAPVINAVFAFDTTTSLKPELYVTLFTRSSPEFANSSTITWFKEEDHEARFKAIVGQLQDRYTLKNPQYYIYCTYPLRNNPYIDEEHQKKGLISDELVDRNLICTGFDQEKQQLKVYNLDLRAVPLFGKATPKVMSDFFDKVVIRLCHENEEKRKTIEDMCSYSEEYTIPLRIGDRWDHPFYAVEKPNIKEIREKTGQESISKKPGIPEKGTEATSSLPAERPVVEPEAPTTIQTTSSVTLASVSAVAPIVKPSIPTTLAGTSTIITPAPRATPTTQPKFTAPKPQPKPTWLGNLKTTISGWYNTAMSGVKSRLYLVAGALAASGGLAAWWFYGRGSVGPQDTAVARGLFKAAK